MHTTQHTKPIEINLFIIQPNAMHFMPFQYNIVYIDAFLLKDSPNAHTHKHTHIDNSIPLLRLHLLSIIAE